MKHSLTFSNFDPICTHARCVPSAMLPIKYLLLSKCRMSVVPGVSAVGVVSTCTNERILIGRWKSKRRCFQKCSWFGGSSRLIWYCLNQMCQSAAAWGSGLLLRLLRLRQRSMVSPSSYLWIEGRVCAIGPVVWLEGICWSADSAFGEDSLLICLLV